MRARLTNLSSLPRTSWTDVAVPHGSLVGHEGSTELTFLTDSGQRFRAVRGGSRGSNYGAMGGEHTDFWRVLATYDGDEAIVGEFIDDSVDGAGPFVLSDWVTDDIAAVIPTWVVRISGIDHRMVNPEITLVESSDAHQRWHLRGRLSGAAAGFVGQVWLTFYSGQDDAEVKANLVWSDRTVPDLSTIVEAVAFESGEFIQLDFRTRNGHLTEALRLGDSWVHVITGPIGFNDGSALPVSGRMLCLPQGGVAEEPGSESSAPVAPTSLRPGSAEIGALTDEPDGEFEGELRTEWRIRNLLAAAEAPVKGVAIDGAWNGKWLAHRWTPRHQDPSFVDADISHADFRRLLTHPGPPTLGDPKSAIYHRRHLGCAENPSRTGDQEDFGSTKGSMAVSLGDPRWLWEAEHALQGDFFRAFMHFETDGSLLLYEDHMQWWTWSGTTHFRQRPPDTLGKVGLWPPDLTGWDGYDDQHRSQNNLCAYLALADDPMLMDMLIHHIRTDQSMLRDRVGAPRAVGRLLLAWAHAYMILPDVWAERIEERMIEKINTVWDDGALSKHSNRVRVISYHGPDGRMNVRDDAGNDLPAWVVWEHGLAAVGLYAAWKATGLRRFLDVLLAICETILRDGVFEEDGELYVCGNVWYPTDPDKLGRPITDFGIHYSLRTPQINVDPRQGGVVVWAMMAILIYTEVGTDVELVGKARRYQRARGRHVEATSWRDAEWNACIERNSSV